MKKTISAQWGLNDPDPRSADAAKMIEDTEWRDWQNEVEAECVTIHDDEVIFRMTDRNREWANIAKAAEAAAKRDGVNTGSPETVRAYAGAAMRNYAEAVRNGDGRELLPNTDWRIRAARRHGDKIVAAMLYREAADAINAETAKVAADAAASESAWSEYYEQQESEIIAAYERHKAEADKRPGKGTSRHAGETIGRRIKGVGKYHILPDGQTIKVAGDSTEYRITSKAALATLDRMLDALGKDPDNGWIVGGQAERARFSAARAKAFAKEYIETEKVGNAYHRRIRLKP